MSYWRAAEVLVAAYRPALFVIDFHGYDAAGHSFYSEAHPEAFGNVKPEDARRYGHVLERYLSLLGRFLSELEKDLEPGDLLLVVSAHGLEPTPLWRRLVGVLSGTDVAAASHAAAPPGLLLAYGEGIRPGAMLRAPRSSTSRRRCSTCSGFRSRATWRGACSPRCSIPATRRITRSRSSRATRASRWLPPSRAPPPSSCRRSPTRSRSGLVGGARAG